MKLRRPHTWVRWLCLRAFVYQMLLRGPIESPERLNLITQAVELGVYLNRCFDGKQSFRAPAYRRLRRGLPREPVREYLHSLRRLETNKHRYRTWDAILEYRRAVIRVSLRLLCRVAGVCERPSLLELCSLIQLMDDVLDREIDHRLQLPTFLAAGAPPVQATARTFWENLKAAKRPDDAPFLMGGWLVYFGVRCLDRVFHKGG